MTTGSRRRRWIAGIVLVPAAAIVLTACNPGPTPAPAPQKASAVTAAADRWGTEDVGQKTRATTTTTTAPAPPSCNGATHAIAIEQCHLTYRSYIVDTTSPSAQSTAARIAALITPAQCQSSLASFHSGSSNNPTPNLRQQYPSATSVSENLYCLYFSTGACPTPAFGASHAVSAWLVSPGHKANMDSILSRAVNGGGACTATSMGGTGVYVAVAQFHNP